MWEIEQHDGFGKRLKDFQKRHRQELANALDNADTFLKALRAGSRPAQIKRGFIHPEPKGVLAFDQSGDGKHLKAIRLYTYPDEDTETVHFITLGDKSTQKEDIKVSSGFVEGLLRSKRTEAQEKQNQPPSNEKNKADG